MAGWILIGFFAAFGMVSTGMTLVCLLFFFRCRGTGGWMILTEQDSHFAGYYHWLSSLGILKCRFLTVSSADTARWLEEQNRETTGGEETDSPDDRSWKL